MINRELVDEAWKELSLTTDSYPAWKKKGYPSTSHWAKGKALLDKVTDLVESPPVESLWPPVGASMVQDWSSKNAYPWLISGDPSYVSVLIGDPTFGNYLRLKNPSNFGGSGVHAAEYVNPYFSNGGYQTPGVLGAEALPGKREETWYRTQIRFPKGLWQPSAGSWNWLQVHHTSRVNRLSNALGIVADGPVGTIGTNPRWYMQLTGGPLVGQPESTQYSDNDERIEGSPVVTDHWYDVLSHYIWDGVNGFVEIIIDGVTFVKRTRPTLCQVPADGSWDYTGVGFYCYRSPIAADTYVDYAHTCWGPTRASVGG